MTRQALAAPPQPAQTSKPAAVLFQGNLAIEKITVKEQIRKKFDENSHKELTESIRTKGLINAVTVRPSSKDYELVAGERRLRAARAAGLTEVPVRVLDLDDQAAALYQVEENVHRKDLTPIEEARGFKLLTQPAGTTAPKYTVEQLAKLVDKSAAYVYRAMALLELPAKAIEAIEAGTITPAHGHQILRVPPTDRNGLLSMAFQNTAKQLQERIDSDQGENLSSARFPVNKPYANEVACTACPYNSGNQGQLFDGAEKGKCLNTKCFEKKTTAATQDQLEVLRKKYPAAKFVQAVSGWIYANHTSDKGFVVRGELGKPPKGEFAIFISNMDGKLYEATPDKAKPSQGRSEGTDWQREQVLDRACNRAELLAILVALKNKELPQEAKKLALDRICQTIPNELIAEAWATGVKNKPVHILAEDFRRLCFVMAVQNYNGVVKKDVAFLKLKLDVIRKNARKAAAKEYDAKKKASK